MKALRQTALLDTPVEASFDRLTRLVSKVLRVPVALISLVDEDRQFFKSCVGLPEPWATERETPLSHSFCQHVVDSGEPLVIEDAREHPLVRENLAIRDLRVIAYAGIPLVTPDGHVLGSLCAIDHRPRQWTEEEVGILSDLAASAMTEVELRAEIRGRNAAEEVQGELEAVIESIPDAVYIGTREGITRSNEAGLRVLGFRSLEELKGNITAVADRTQPRDAISGEPIRPEEGPFARALRGERVVREMIVRHAQTGGDRVLRVAAAPVRVADEVRGAVIVTTDVTERSEAEAEIEGHRAFLRAVIDSSPGGVFVKDAEGRFTLANPVMAGFYGLAPGEMVGRTDADLGLPPERVERFQQMDQRVIETGETISLSAEPLTSPHTGETRWVETRKVPLPAPGGGRQVLGIVTDVTERERATQDLAAAHGRLEHLLTAGPAVIYSCRAEGDYGATFISDNVRAQLGYAPEQFTRSSSFWVDNIHPEDRGAVLSGLGALFETDHHTHEYRFRCPDGTYLWMSDELRLVRDEHGAPQEIVGYWTNVTQRKEAEEALRESERRLSTLISNLPGVAYRSRNDPDWTMEYIGGRTEELLGYAPEQFLGEEAVSLAERIHPEDRERVREGVSAAVRAREPYRLEYRVRTAGGEEKWIWEQGEGIFGPGGELQALEGFLTDVTERKEAEERERQIVRERAAREQAEAAQSRIEDLLESITDAFFALDEHWLFTYVNAEAERVLRRSREELLGSSFWESFPEAVGSVFEEQYRRAVEAQQPVDFEAYYPPLDGWFEVRAYPSAEGLTVYFRDVSEQRQSREALRQSEERYRIIARATHDAIWEFDPATGQLQWSPTFASVFGGEAGNIERWSSRIHPEDRDRVGAAFEHAMAQQAPEWSEEYRFQREDGAYADVFDRAVFDYDAEGRLLRVVGALMDVSERRRAEQALRLSEQRFRSLTEHSSDVVTVLDADGLIQYESASAEGIVGYDPKELLGRSAFELIHPDDLPAVLAAFGGVLEEPGQTRQVEFRFRHRDGSWRYLEAIATNLLDDPAVQGVVVNSRDVTRRVEAREQLRESEERFRQMAESIREVFWLSDAALSKSLYISPAYEEIWGRPADESPWMESVHEEDRAHVAAASAAALAGSRPMDVEYRIVRPDGEVRWIHDRSFPVLDAEGAVYRIAGIAEDITDRKYIEEALQRSQNALEAMLHASPDIVEILSLEGRFHWTSPAMRTVLGYDPAEVRGRLMLDLIHPEDRESAKTSLDEIAAGTREEIRERYRARHVDGHWVALEASGRTMVRDGERSLMVVARDVTVQVGLEEASRAAKQQAERANQAKSDFLSRMSHELRTPMNAILGFAQILEMDVDGDENRESVEQILRAGRHLLGLVNEVLDLSRIEAGEMGLSVEPVAVREAVSQSVEMVRHMAAQQGVTLSAHQALETNSLVAADLQRLKQVLLNLVSNAIKYNRRGGSVTLSCERATEGTLRFVVEDTGYGIAPEKMDRLFVPFERLSAEGSGVEGTGLGLALSRGLMEAMGGSLGAESRPGVGSRFWAELPVITPTEDAAPQAEPESATPMVETPGEQTHTVLLVEDNLTNVRLMERVFRRRPQVRLLVAMQGSVGLDLAREHRPGLILLDLNLPDLSGRDVLRRLRTDPALRDVPVIMVSGDATPEQVERLRAEGAQGYITKPFNVLEVLRLVDDTLAGD